MQAMLDLFGNPVEICNSKQKASTQSKPRAKVVLDRRQIWSDGGLLAEIEEDEDDISIATTESFTENATIERLEQALFMAPKIKNGHWVYDGTFWGYKLVKVVLGTRQFGAHGSLLREGTSCLVLASARKVLEEAYNDTGAWLPRYAIWVLSKRLRMAEPHEDPYELLRAFTAVITQHDYLDASRKGDSLRRVIKRERMREQRAAKRNTRGADVESDESFAESA